MPEQYKAESAIVQPAPPTHDAITVVINDIADQSERVALIFPEQSGPGANMVGGLQLGLAIAIDHPEAVRPLLAAIDENKRRAGSDDGDGEEGAARAAAGQSLADAALGINAILPDSNFRWN